MNLAGGDDKFHSQQWRYVELKARDRGQEGDRIEKVTSSCHYSLRLKQDGEGKKEV